MVEILVYVHDNGLTASSDQRQLLKCLFMSVEKMRRQFMSKDYVEVPKCANKYM